MKQLTGLDASFLYMETPNAPMHIAGLALYDPSTSPSGRLAFEDVLENVERRLHLAAPFRQRLAMVPMSLDHPYWIEDPDFDLEYHVRHRALPKPGGFEQLTQVTGRLMSRPLDLKRPLWELHVIEGLHVPDLPEGAFAVFTKVHHAAVDGMSGVEITTALHDLVADADVPPPESEWEPERVPTELDLLARTYGSAVTQPLRFAEVMVKTAGSAARVGERLRRRELRPPPTPFTAPRTRFNAPVSPRRVVDGRRFSLDEIREVRAGLPGVTVNDVVLAICAGALRQYLLEKDELPAQSLVAMAPISVRPEAARRSMGNQVAAMLVALGTHIEDPKERLHEIHANTSNSKEYTQAVGAKLMTDYSQFIPSVTAGLAARLYSRMQVARAHKPAFNLVVTNVPGPQVPLYSAGCRLITQFGGGPIFDGMGLIVPVFSYCGELTISMTSCREMLPDASRLADLLVESFQEIRSAVPVGSPRDSRRSSSKS